MLEDRVILKEDRGFVVSDVNGDSPANNELGLGLYRSDTRFLSCYELRLNGRPPILLNNSVGRAYVATFQLVNPHLVTPNGPIPRQVLSLRRTRFVHRGLHDRVGIQNCSPEPVAVDIELTFGADFLDIFEVRGYHAVPERGEMLQEATETGFLFTYQGLDDVVRETEVVFHPKHGLARIFRRLGRKGEADRLEDQARELRRRFESAYWMPELGFYAQA